MTGFVRDDVFFVSGWRAFVLGNRGWQIEVRQGLEGRAQPVPAGVRSATRGMEPKGGTPESPHKWPSCHFFARILHGPSRASGTEF